MGRPLATTHAEIEAAAFRLFAQHGFEQTTMEAIAAEVGVGRRTLFRYYASKNDIPWGQFDRTLVHFRDLLAAQPHDLPVLDAVGCAVVAFNDFPEDAVPRHTERMRLILTTPALRAHSALRYSQWRLAVADYVAGRLGERPGDLRPVLLGHVALGIALSAYEQWLSDGTGESADLLALLEEAAQAVAGAGGSSGSGSASGPRTGRVRVSTTSSR